MAEDDFDIYGEDDGFAVQAEEVRLSFFCAQGVLTQSQHKSLGYEETNQDQNENAAHSPVVGEKRPREEDETED